MVGGKRNIHPKKQEVNWIESKKKMEKKEFGLFKLHTKEDKTPRLWICAIGKNLHNQLDELINELIRKKAFVVTYVKIKKEIMQKIYNKAILKAGNQQDLAKILNVPRQNLYKWKECKRRIPLLILTKLIKYSKLNFDIREMNLETKKHLLKFNRQKIAQIIARKLNTRLNFPERIIYGKRKEVALIFIIELLNLWKSLLNKSDKELEKKKIEILRTFEFLKQNTNKARNVKVVSTLNPMFAKVVGAMLADGHITNSDNSLKITDGERINMENFSTWMKELFNVFSIVRKCKNINAWTLKIDNKVIQRYFTEFFKFSKGKKKENYSIPSIIKNSDCRTRKACVCGVMVFDGSVRINKEIGLNIGSKKLRDEVFKILTEDGLKVNKLNKPDFKGMWRLYSAGRFDEEQYKKWLDYFIEGSNKWFRIYEFINGFSCRVNKLKYVFIILEKCFPAQSASKIDLALIFRIFVSDKTLTLKQILSRLSKKNIVVTEETLCLYINLLRKMDIVRKKRLSNNTNLYILNENLSEWTLPYHPELKKYYSI